MDNNYKSRFSFFTEDTDTENTDPNDLLKQVTENVIEKPDFDFEKVARYRCDQINLTKVQGDITFSSSIKNQYLLSQFIGREKYYHVKLEDYIYEIDPKAMEMAFEIVKPLEFIRNNVKFIQNKEAEILDIINMDELSQNWVKFKADDLPNIGFFKMLNEQNPKSTEDIVRTGDEEFSSVGSFKKLINKNLFYHILLNVNIGDNIKDHTLTQSSQLFPNQSLNLNVISTKITEDASKKVFVLAGILQRDQLNEEVLKRQYDDIYKPLIKYSYTEYDYMYSVTYTIDTLTGLMLSGKASVIEKIKNNYESITEFQIKRVEL